MRLILVGVLLAAFACARDASGLVILYEFDNTYSNGAFADMQHELSGIMHDTGLEIEWHAKPTASFPPTTSEIVIIRFHGRCNMDGLITAGRHGGGTLASTHIVNGEVLPFSDVNCDLVRANVRAAMLGYDKERAELFLGRALGRVVAHELWHILSGSTTHGRHGVTGRCLSPRQLVTDHLAFLEEDLHKLFAKRRRERLSLATTEVAAHVPAGSSSHADSAAHLGNGTGEF